LSGNADNARRYQVTVRTVERYWKRYRETSEIAARRQGGYRISRLAPHDGRLRRWIEEKPDLTLMELQERCALRLKVAISLHALWYRLERLGLSFKKTTRAAEQDRPDLVLARREWRTRQPFWDVRRLVFIDETGVNTKMARALRSLSGWGALPLRRAARSLAKLHLPGCAAP